MKKVTPVTCFIIVCFVSMFNQVLYGFSYEIDTFTQVGGLTGTSTFVDKFDDEIEPPDGLSGPATYSDSDENLPLGIASNRETNGF
ncbi:MAG: hypothetical protein ACUZ8O_12795 [Candidatus Anammoxibacter sp.]